MFINKPELYCHLSVSKPEVRIITHSITVNNNLQNTNVISVAQFNGNEYNLSS